VQTQAQVESAEAYEEARAAVKAAEAAVETAQAALCEAMLSFADPSVRAPFDGWISARNVDRGALVGNATTAFSMVDIHLVKAVFAVPDTSLRMVRPGQKQTVMLDTLEHALQGVVTSISPQADPRTRVFPVEVTLANPRSEVKPGMIVSHVIVLFDFIEDRRGKGARFEQAIRDAGIERLRPVLITVGATILALFPLASHGGPRWQPLCYAQIGGLTVATFITLLLVPVLYSIAVLDLRIVKWEAA